MEKRREMIQGECTQFCWVIRVTASSDPVKEARGPLLLTEAEWYEVACPRTCSKRKGVGAVRLIRQRDMLGWLSVICTGPVARERPSAGTLAWSLVDWTQLSGLAYFSTWLHQSSNFVLCRPVPRAVRTDDWTDTELQTGWRTVMDNWTGHGHSLL